MKRITLKSIIIIVSTIGLCIAGYILWMLSVFGTFDKDYSPEELARNFNAKHREIFELINYYEAIVPQGKQVEIEFKNDKELVRFGVSPFDSVKGQTGIPDYLNWNLKIGSHELDSVLNTIKWNYNTLSILKTKLDNANCIQIENGHLFRVGFKRSGLGMYSYYIFDKPLSDSTKKDYNKRLKLNFFKDNVAWKYDGGATG